jgi:hypothetical protein
MDHIGIDVHKKDSQICGVLPDLLLTETSLGQRLSCFQQIWSLLP